MSGRKQITLASTAERAALDEGTSVEAAHATQSYLLPALVAGYVLWACAFIYRTSYVTEGVRYFTLMDDEMISMRYAKNFVHGYGLVFNPGGDRVEGFTNPAWVLYMALVHLLPVSPPKISLLVQLTCLVLLAMNLVVVARLGELVSGSRRVGLSAAFLTAFYVGIANWGLQGSEVAPLTLLMSASALMAILCVQRQTSPIPLYLLMGFATTFRTDAVVPAAVVIAMLAYVDERRRLQHAIIGTLILAFFVAAQTGFNFSYYGYPFPNTYYLKLTGFPLIPRLTRGIIVTLKFLVEMNPFLTLLLIALLVLHRDWRLLLLCLMLGTVLLYNIWVGGDFTEDAGGSNRFIAIVMPLFFVLLSCALDACASSLASTFGSFSANVKSGRGGVLAVLTALALIALDLPIRSDALGFGLNDVGSLPCASLLLLVPPYKVEMNSWDTLQAVQVSQITDPDARIMVGGAGVTPYFADRFAIEVLGKTDRVVAHENWKQMQPGARWQAFLPGHFKWDYAHSIGEMKPDLIITLLPWDQVSAQPWLKDYKLVSFGGALDHCYVRNDWSHVHTNPSSLLSLGASSSANRSSAQAAARAAFLKWQQDHPSLKH